MEKGIFVSTLGGRQKEKIRRKNRGLSTLLKYIPTAHFLLPLVKLLPLTNGPKKRPRMEGQRILHIFFVFSSTLATDGLGSGCLRPP
jgi:hypothetical protein